MTYNADGTASRKLLDALGLPLDTGVVEWQTYGAVPELIATTSAGSPTSGGTSIVVPIDPARTEGDLLVLVAGRLDGMTTPPGWTLVDEALTETVPAGALAVYTRTSDGTETAVTVEGPSSNLYAGIVAVIRNPATAVVTVTEAQDPAAATFNAPQPEVPGDVVLSFARIDGDNSAGDEAITTISGDTLEHVSLVDTFGSTLWELAATEGPGAFSTGVFDGSTNWLGVTVAVGASGGTGWSKHEGRSSALVGYSTTHGRPSPLDNVGPLTGSVQLARTMIGSIPTGGERFRLALSADVGTALGVPQEEWPRFTGEITDVDVTAEGDLSIVSVTGVGRSSRLARVPIVTIRPAELDGERVRRALYQAAWLLPLDLGTFDPGTVTVRAEDYSTGGNNARGVVDQITQDSLGQLVEHRSGRLDWHDAEHRRDLVSVVTLTGSDHIIKPFRWAQSVATVVNDAEVTYGPAEARATVRVTDSVSADVVNGLGPYGVQLDTTLDAEEDAYALASTVVGRYAQPSWMLPDLTVDVVRTAGDQAGAVLALTHGDKVTASGLPPDGAFTAGDLFVEGTTETYTRTAWRVSLAVADPAIAGVGIRWLDVDPELQWRHVDPDVTWLDAATIAAADVGDPVDIVDGGSASSTDTETIDGGSATSTDADTYDGGAAA